MGAYFAKEYTGGAFVLFDTIHLITLGLIVLFNLSFVGIKNASEQTKTRLRWGMTIVLWLNELSWHIWNYANGQWDIRIMLPLHLCSVFVWLGGIMLITKNYAIYEFAYFMGIAGAMQALLTPDVGIYGFPHYRYWQSFISHGLIVSAPIYMTIVEGYRPTWKSLGRVFLWVNVYMAVVFVINLLIGSNYLYVAHKPPTASLLDILPPWPYYILFIELIGIVLTLILYLPFAIKDWAASKTTE